jgi:hypothetical protein
VNENQELELNGLNQVLAVANSINFMGHNMKKVKNNAEIALQVNKEISLELNVYESK